MSKQTDDIYGLELGSFELSMLILRKTSFAFVDEMPYPSNITRGDSYSVSFCDFARDNVYLSRYSRIFLSLSFSVYKLRKRGFVQLRQTMQIQTGLQGDRLELGRCYLH